jgi:hypothetical protein
MGLSWLVHLHYRQAVQQTQTPPMPAATVLWLSAASIGSWEGASRLRERGLVAEKAMATAEATIDSPDGRKRGYWTGTYFPHSSLTGSWDVTSGRRGRDKTSQKWLLLVLTPRVGGWENEFDCVHCLRARTVLKVDRVVVSADARHRRNCRVAFTSPAKLPQPGEGKSADPRCFKLLLHAALNILYIWQ